MTESLFSKNEMSEEDVKNQYITPAILKKWPKRKIRLEYKITDEPIVLQGSKTVKKPPKFADYVLFLNAHVPLAVVEAKSNKHGSGYGIQQAMAYAEALDVKFAYSSNGDFFVEHDYLTGQERELSLDEFPSEEELVARLRSRKTLSQNEERALNQPYYTGMKANGREPRYYQRVAINRTVDAIAGGRDRVLLVMATGTGKTYAAFQIVWRLLESGLKRKVLYLADRNVLVDQSIRQDFSPLEKKIHKIDLSKDDLSILQSYEVYFALYQQLVGDDDQEHYSELFAPDYFDLIIVDECHRGSAKEESRWRRILEYFSSASQIGMTATPKETKYVSNVNYFGEPLYTYSLRQGIEDGFLAPFRVINVTFDVGEGWKPYKGQVDKYGNDIEDRVYNNSDFDSRIVLEHRTKKVAECVTKYLQQNDRMARTIVFCQDEDAADRMRMELVNLNADMVKENPDYVVRITGHDKYGQSKLEYFISKTAPYPVIATTSKLLSTGVDCKTTKLIILDQNIGSMTEFKQIIGRGTRLVNSDDIPEIKRKESFVVMDFRNVTRLFADESWDGPVQIDDDFAPDKEAEPKPKSEEKENPEPEKKVKPVVDVNGCRVEIVGERFSVFDAETNSTRVENLVDYTKYNILGHFGSLEKFIAEWRASSKKDFFREIFKNWGIDLDALKARENMANYDDFDFICHLAFDQKPLTRRERAQKAKQSGLFDKYSGKAREVLEALLDKYTDHGVYEIEEIAVLKIDPFQKLGQPVKIVGYFGGKENYLEAVHELENAIYQGKAA